MAAALEGSEWSAARPGRTLPPGKTRYPFYRRVGESQGRSGRAENLVPTGIQSRTVEALAQSLYQLSYRAHKSLCRQSEIIFFIQPSAENHPCHNYTCPHNNTYTYPTHQPNYLLILLPKYKCQTTISALLAEDIHAHPPAVQIMIDVTRQAMYV